MIFNGNITAISVPGDAGIWSGRCYKKWNSTVDNVKIFKGNVTAKS
jgi:hypothetical protein